MVYVYIGVPCSASASDLQPVEKSIHSVKENCYNHQIFFTVLMLYIITVCYDLDTSTKKGQIKDPQTQKEKHFIYNNYDTSVSVPVVSFHCNSLRISSLGPQCSLFTLRLALIINGLRPSQPNTALPTHVIIFVKVQGCVVLKTSAHCMDIVSIRYLGIASSLSTLRSTCKRIGGYLSCHGKILKSYGKVTCQSIL